MTTLSFSIEESNEDIEVKDPVEDMDELADNTVTEESPVEDDQTAMDDRSESLDEITDTIDDAMDDLEGLQSVGEVVSDSVEKGDGMTPAAADLTTIATEAFSRKWEMRVPLRLPALEDYGHSKPRYETTKLALENLGEIIRNALQALLKAAKNVLRFLIDFFRTFSMTAKKLKAQSSEILKDFKSGKLVVNPNVEIAGVIQKAFGWSGDSPNGLQSAVSGPRVVTVLNHQAEVTQVLGEVLGDFTEEYRDVANQFMVDRTKEKGPDTTPVSGHLNELIKTFYEELEAIPLADVKRDERVAFDGFVYGRSILAIFEKQGDHHEFTSVVVKVDDALDPKTGKVDPLGDTDIEAICKAVDNLCGITEKVNEQLVRVGNFQSYLEDLSSRALKVTADNKNSVVQKVQQDSIMEFQGTTMLVFNTFLKLAKAAPGLNLIASQLALKYVDASLMDAAPATP